MNEYEHDLKDNNPFVEDIVVHKRKIKSAGSYYARYSYAKVCLDIKGSNIVKLNLDGYYLNKEGLTNLAKDLLDVADLLDD